MFATAVGTREEPVFRPTATPRKAFSAMLLSISTSHYCSTRSGHPTVSAGMRTLCRIRVTRQCFHLSLYPVIQDCISGAALAFLAARRCSAVHPGLLPLWHTVHRYAAGLPWYVGGHSCMHIVDFSPGMSHTAASVILPDSYNTR